VRKYPAWVRCLALFWWIAAGAPAQQAPLANSIVRIGFEAHALGNANRTDVTAAMKAWMLAVTKEQGLAYTTNFKVYDSLDDLVSALRHEQLEVFNASMDEFLILEKKVPCKGIFASLVHGKMTEQYVLLVHKDRVINGLNDLRGESIAVLDHPRTSLAPHWLDAELLRNKLPISARFFGKISHVTKPNLAVLPVFFKQMAAALVTRSSFEALGELNPQLSRQVRVLRSSPELVPGVGAYPRSANSAAVELYRTQALKLGTTAAGKLILNLFQIEGIVEIKESELAETRSFLAECAKLRDAAGRKGAAP